MITTAIRQPFPNSVCKKFENLLVILPRNVEKIVAFIQARNIVYV